MTNITTLCQYVQKSDYISMAEFLAANPDNTLINGMCNITNLVPLHNNIYADTIFGEMVSPLFFATAKDDEKMVNIIAKQSNLLEIDSTSIYQDTPLMVSSLYGNFNIIKILIDNGASVIRGDEHNNTALHKTAARGNFARIMGISCCTKDYIEIANLLLKKGADINAIASGDGQPDGAPLNVAIGYNDFNMTKFLLKEGADTSIQDGKGITSLCEIPKKFNADEAKELIQYSDFIYTDPICNPIGTNTCAAEANQYQKICSNGLSSECKEHFPIEFIPLVVFFPIAGPVGWFFTGLGAILGCMVKTCTECCCGIDNFYTNNAVPIGALASGALLSGYLAANVLYNRFTDDCIET